MTDITDTEAWPEVAKIPGADQAAADAAGLVAGTAAVAGEPASLFTAPGAEPQAPRPARGGMLVCADPKCRADIYKPLTENGRTMPVDADPNPAGNLVWRQVDVEGRREWRMHVLGKSEKVDPGTRRFMPHWKTCKSPEAFRRREARAAPERPAVELLELGGLGPVEPVRTPPPRGDRSNVIYGRFPRAEPAGAGPVTRDPAPSLAEVGAAQGETVRRCGKCGTVCPAAMPDLESGALVLLEVESGLYDQLAVRVDGRWLVRPVDPGEPSPPYWNRRGSHTCRDRSRRCQTPGHGDRPASLYPGGVFCSSCATSR